MLGFGFNEYERSLLEERCARFVMLGMPQDQARNAARKEMKEAIAESKAAGLYGLGPAGRMVLKRYKVEAQFRRQWDAMVAAGVKDEDVIEWWDLPDFYRRLMSMDDAVFRVSFFHQLLEQGKPDQEAGRIVWKSVPVYGDPTAPPTFPDDPKSTMLPVEMELRWIRWAERAQASGEWDGVKKAAEECGTMNEYIRSLARQGRL